MSEDKIKYEDIEQFSPEMQERIQAKMKFSALTHDCIKLQSVEKELKDSWVFAKITDLDVVIHERIRDLQEHIGHGNRFLEVPEVITEED